MRTNSSEKCQALLAQLGALADEVSAQARPRPLVIAPLETVRLAAKLIAQVRQVMKSARGAVLLPRLRTKGEVPLGALALLLGQVRASLETHMHATGLDQPAQSTIDIEASRKKLERIIEARVQERLNKSSE